MNQVRVGLVAIGLLLLAAGPAHAGALQAKPGMYAEGVYAEYAAGTGHQIAFEVKTLSTGRLEDIVDVPFGELIAPSGHRVDAWQVGTELRAPRFITTLVTESPDLEYTAAGFKEVGYPLGLGAYRTLQVSATIGSETKQHQAIEFCWALLGHCTILDPTVLFVDSMVKNRLRLAVEGWGPQAVVVSGNEKAPGQQDIGTTAVCGLASRPGTTDMYHYWSGYWIEYHNVFGMTLIRKDLGAQKSGIRCNTSCQPSPYGYSYASSCQGFLGWSCACDSDFGYGTTGSTGKWIAETKCTHKYLLQAQASASVSNLGSASVSINWVMDGTPDANGGQIMDTCGYY